MAGFGGDGIFGGSGLEPRKGAKIGGKCRTPENPALRSMMSGILAENRQMRRQITLLKAEGNRVIDMRPRPAENREPVQILPASTGLYPSEIEALRHAVSDRLLRDEGWTSDAEGRVLNEAGRVIFKPGYVTAIRKIIGEGDTFARQSAKQVGVGTDKLDALEPE